MLFRPKRRSGFTLAETLVTVAIIAVLAAVVVPAVTQQLGKGDAPSFNGSVQSLRTEITSFVSDVRKFPGKVDQLQKKPTFGIDFDLSGDGAGAGTPAGTVYTSAITNRWKGPYDNTGNATGTIPIGFGWSTNNIIQDTSSFVAVQLTKSGAVVGDAQELDAAIDASDGPTLGLVRWRSTAPPALIPVGTVFLFLMSSAR